MGEDEKKYGYEKSWKALIEPDRDCYSVLKVYAQSAELCWYSSLRWHPSDFGGKLCLEDSGTSRRTKNGGATADVVGDKPNAFFGNGLAVAGVEDEGIVVKKLIG